MNNLKRELNARFGQDFGYPELKTQSYWGFEGSKTGIFSCSCCRKDFSFNVSSNFEFQIS